MRRLFHNGNVGVLFGLLVLAAWRPVLPAEKYVERISSFETDAEAFMFVYHAEGKGRARISDEQASDGRQSLELQFMASEAEIFSERNGGVLASLGRALARSLGISTDEEYEPGKLAQLGRSADVLPFDWAAVDALAFDAYNPSAAPVQLSLKVKSGWHDWDPAAKLHRTRVTLPSKQWTLVRLSRKAMGEDLHPGGVIFVRLYLPTKGTLYVDRLRFVASETPLPETKYVRLTWTEDPKTTQTINWQSRAATGAVRFGPSGGTLSETAKSTGTRVFGWGHGAFHEALLNDLDADTEYDYQIRSGDGPWTPTKTFRTAPDTDDAVFTFLAGSDTKGAREVMSQLLKLFEADDPRLMIYAGDAPHTGGHAAQWGRWFQAVEPFAAYRPVMQSTGNHELGDDPKLVNFRRYTAFPERSGNGVYYSFDYGPVHFVCLDTDSGLYEEQLPWLKEDLAASNKPWKVVYFHRPPFSSDTVHGSDLRLRNSLGPIFSRHHVNLVLSGHGHLYERSKPINLLNSMDSPVGSYEEGTCYVVSGGAGAGLYRAKAGNWWTAVVKTQVHHFCRIKVDGSKSMTLEAVDLHGHVIDRVTLRN